MIMDNQKKNKLLSANKGKPHDCRTTLILQTKILKNTLPRHISGPGTAGHILTPIYLGARARRLKECAHHD